MGRLARAVPPSPPPNPLALTSVALALVFPLGVLCELLSSSVVYQSVAAAIPLSSYVGDTLVLMSLPATPLAIVAGHVALHRADRQAFQRPLRGVARLGLALGYGSLLGLAVLVVWVLGHGIRVHYVF